MQARSSRFKPERPGPPAMPRTPAAWPSTQDEALLAVAILARDADGLVRPEELRFFAEHLSPGLHRMDGEARAAVAASLAELLESKGLKGALLQIRQALPERSA